MHGKSYLVTKLDGDHSIYRDGQLAGSWPQAGYQVQVFGVCTALAGTELAAHALAEVYRNIEPHRRQWVLTEAEYEEHLQLREADNRALLDRYPLTPTEAAIAQQHEDRYAKVSADGRANIKRKLLNLSPYQYIDWDSNPRKRPAEFPTAFEEEPAASMRP